ncbi:MAG: hypothetical protein Q9192_007127, partial [Flavoplaca navasiana]
LKLKDYADILESASVYFLDTLDELLSDLVHSDDELLLLLGNPAGSLWKETKYEDRLRMRLDRSYTSYFKTVAKLVQALQRMRDRLGIDHVGSVKWDDYTALEREMKRLKLTFSKSVYKELLDEIRLANQDLRECTHQNIALESKKHQRKARSALADLRLIRRHAASLYQVLINDNTWKCQCGMDHLASLRLEARPQTNNMGSTDATKTHAFRMLLSVTNSDLETTSTAQWQDIEILPSLTDQRLTEQPPVPRSPNPSRVRFTLDTSGSGIAGYRARIPTERNPKYIQEFCSALCATNKHIREIGLLLDEMDDRQEHRIYRSNTELGSQTSSKSLEDLLKATEHSDAERLSRRDRLEIAVILASSVLQLDGTSWLKNGWSSSDICFHHRDGKRSQYSQPYLSWQRCCNAQPACPITSLGAVGNHMIRHEILLALGLTLVELCFGRTLTEMRKPEDINADGTTSRLATAARLHGRVYDEMGIAYGDAVRRCLFQLFDVRELNLEIEEVQQKVYDDVVRPLMDDLNNFNGVLRVR